MAQRPYNDSLLLNLALTSEDMRFVHDQIDLDAICQVEQSPSDTIAPDRLLDVRWMDRLFEAYTHLRRATEGHSGVFGPDFPGDPLSDEESLSGTLHAAAFKGLRWFVPGSTFVTGRERAYGQRGAEALKRYFEAPGNSAPVDVQADEADSIFLANQFWTKDALSQALNSGELPLYTQEGAPLTVSKRTPLANARRDVFLHNNHRGFVDRYAALLWLWSWDIPNMWIKHDKRTRLHQTQAGLLSSQLKTYSITGLALMALCLPRDRFGWYQETEIDLDRWEPFPGLPLKDRIVSEFGLYFQIYLNAKSSGNAAAWDKRRQPTEDFISKAFAEYRPALEAGDGYEVSGAKLAFKDVCLPAIKTDRGPKRNAWKVAQNRLKVAEPTFK